MAVVVKATAACLTAGGSLNMVGVPPAKGVGAPRLHEIAAVVAKWSTMLD